MDLEEWEFVSDDGFLEIHDDGGKKNFSSKYGTGKTTSPRNDFSMDYFGCPSPISNQFVDSTEESPLSFQLDDPIVDLPDDVAVKHLTANVTVSILEPPAPSAEKDPISQVFDKKTEENEFADMKIDSPKSGSKGFVPQSDGEAIENNNSAGKKEEEEGMDLWKGVGAICSFGMAAATICIMIFGNAQTNKHKQKLRIQIYSDDKRINQVVQQQATKLNEAIPSAARGVPLTRAHITSGGYYDGL